MTRKYQHVVANISGGLAGRKGTHAGCLAMAMKIGWGVSEVSRYCGAQNSKS
jgi:hypothetical protein